MVQPVPVLHVDCRNHNCGGRSPGRLCILFLGMNNQRLETLSDSPEYANDVTAANVIQWLIGQAHSYGWILGIIAIIGILFVIFCITFTIIGWIGRRIEISGTDQTSEIQEKGRRKAETEEQYDDYGQPAEY